MSIFKSKKKEYTIVTDMAMNGAVREFAAEHCAEGCEPDVRVHGCLLEGDHLVTIMFESDQEETVVYSDLVDAFLTNRLAIRRKLIFVFKKEEESE